MAEHSILVEIVGDTASPFERFSTDIATSSVSGAALSAAEILGAMDIGIDRDAVPIPMLIGPDESGDQLTDVMATLQIFGLATARHTDAAAVHAHSTVLACHADDSQLEKLRDRTDVIVWPNSKLALISSSPGAECWPFSSGATAAKIQTELGVHALWNLGHRGNGVVVGILDEGIDGSVYPVGGGFARTGQPVQPGKGSVKSHGSMCAADVLVAAPDATLFDYPFLGIPNSGGALQMFQAVLSERGARGVPNIINCSFGYYQIPARSAVPRHEVYDLNHPVHRKIREVVAAGVACFFAAGNCGQDCPSRDCGSGAIGPGRSIHGSNSLNEVITVAAVNSKRVRIGYSSQGPGMFHSEKPDVACYSHFFGNFGPGRPGGTSSPFDSGTSAASPLAAGVGALLVSAFSNLDPATLKLALCSSASRESETNLWDGNVGYGIVDAEAAYNFLQKLKHSVS